MKSSPEEMFSEQPFITFVQQVINRSKAFGCALNFQEWRYGQEEQIWEGLFGCRLSWGVSLIAAERTSFLLQPDGAMAFAASTSQEREGGGVPRRGIEIQMHREGLVRSRHLQKPPVRYKMKYHVPLRQSKK